MLRLPRVALALALLPLAITGCLPNRFVIDLAGTDGRLLERQVLADKAATAKVALIDLEGLIAHTSAGVGLIAGSGNSVDDLVARLELAEKDPEVKAVILRINSPGGTVAASDTMYQEILGFRSRSGKPVVASMAEVAASGGYYVALAADRIIAQPSSITGSIGVLVQTMNFSRGMEMIGIEARSVTSGSNKAIASPFEPPNEEHYRILQSTVNDFYRGFRERVATRRPALDHTRLDTLADGRIFTGTQALEAGLVDELGGLRDSFARAKELARLPAARIVKYHPPGRVPTSPYAVAAADTPAHTAGTNITLLQLNTGGPLVPSAGFYYIWLPPTP